MENKKPLIDAIEKRRSRMCLGYLKFGKAIKIDGSTLWRFANGQRKLSIDLVRDLARHATEQNDKELFDALALYALGTIWEQPTNEARR